MKMLSHSPVSPASWSLPGVDYALAVPRDARARLAFAWLMLGVVSLIAAGLFSVLLVASRTPLVQGFFPLVDFFHVALVVHVDLSVLVWFSAFAGVFWSLNCTVAWLPGGWTALVVCSAGALAMAAAAFVGAPQPIMSNYVPVLDGALFLGGLAAFAVGAGLLVLRAMRAVPRVGTVLDGQGALRFALNAAAVSAAIALGAFFWSWLEVPAALEGKAYYELLFWGGGHVLQFTWTLLMFAAWLWLASESGCPLPLTPRVAVLLFGIALASVFVTPIIYLAWDVASVEHHRLLTWLMRFGGGLTILPIGLAVIYALWRARAGTAGQQALRAVLAMSAVLFAFGGLIGLTIEGSNVKVPAHYHGSIVGVTLAFMGVAYLLLPRLGYSRVNARAARVQARLYGVGQMLHITGLVWSGGYGVQRKVAGAAQGLDALEKVAAMGLMGFGGLIAVIGGVMFIVIVLKSVLRGRQQAVN
ncbi:MAG TPA: cytochrome C oxidase subunit I [Burkholderiales bacterium]|nr:cytochrome C oxidase subunit I [Burkholderiales bacterium]